MRDFDLNLTTRIAKATAAIALAITILLPGIYFGIRYSAIAASVSTEAKIQADTITQLIVSSPEMWKFQEHRLKELLHRSQDSAEHESARILDRDGTEVTSAGRQPEYFNLTRSAGLFDSGTLVGRVEVTHSLRGMLLETVGVALLDALLGFTVFVLLRLLSRRARNLNDTLYVEKARAETTLHSIQDGVITTSTDEIIEYLNPAAETLTGWSLSEARGRPIHEVMRLIDEQTLEPVTNLLARAGDGVQSFVRQIALLKRDNSSIAIEGSTASIRDHSEKIIGGVIVFHDVSVARSMAQRMTWQATHDPLTGLVNRREFESRADAAIASAKNSDKQHVVIYMDLDQFKVVNDTCGHAAGDELLKQISTLLQSKLRESDTLARLGGDEFGLLMYGCSLERAKLIAADLLAAVRDYHLNWEGKVLSVGISMGLAEITQDTISRADILSAADSAMFAAKEQGRNRFCVFHTADVEQTKRLNEMSWVARIKLALVEKRFRLYYQRYLPLKTGADADIHIEVLLRLIDEDGKVILPASFLPAAERYDLMPAIDRWVVSTVFKLYRELATHFAGGPLTCAINLSGSSLNSEGFLDFIREQAATHNLPHAAICFEITETAAINNLRKTAKFMKEIQAIGFLFALDDFGTGTSSFGYLKNLPVDFLKIDGGFVKNMMNDPLDRAMTETINRIGHIVGTKTVAEFAENEMIIGGLETMGVDFAQGFGFHEPSPLPAGTEIEEI